ncbi:MAG TPA: ATP-binding protein [Chitinophagaceae bacterium]|nr:ATP-binding protein [Chitinophagaceae bacterium]
MGKKPLLGEDAFTYTLLCEALDKCAQAIVLLDAAGAVIYATHHVEALTGYPVEALVGTPASAWLLPEDRPAAQAQHRVLLQQADYSVSASVRLVHRDGHSLPVEVRVKSLLDHPLMNCILVFLRQSGRKEQRKAQRIRQCIARAKEEERQYLAMELHDNVHQVITASKLLVDAARTADNKEELLRLSSDQLQAAAGEVRNLSYALAGNELQPAGLEAAVKAFAGTVCKGAALAITVRFDLGPVTLSAGQHLQVYRIIQECVQNVLRHAGATGVAIALYRKGGMLCLQVEDDGKGFAPEKVRRGVGLTGIGRRVQLLNGRLHIQSAEGRGTRIEVHFPV